MKPRTWSAAAFAKLKATYSAAFIAQTFVYVGVFSADLYRGALSSSVLFS